MLTRTSGLCLALAFFMAPCPAAAANDAAWDDCVKTPKRACIIQEALRLAQATDHDHFPAALLAVARAQVAFGLTNEALATYRQALDVAISFNEGTASAGVFGEVAADLAKAGLTRQSIAILKIAFEYISSVKDPMFRFVGLELVDDNISGAIDILAAKAGKELFALLKNAQQITLANVQMPWVRAPLLAIFAKLQAKIGPRKEALVQFKQAVQLARSLQSGDPLRASSLMWIAAAQVEAGFANDGVATFQRAVEDAVAIKEVSDRAAWLRHITQKEAEAGLTDNAIKVADLIKDEPLRASALADIAKALAKSGSVDSAQQIASSLTEAWERASVLVEIAKAQAKAERKDETIVTLKQIEQLAPSIKFDYIRDQALADVAAVYVEIGMIDESLRVALLIYDESARSPALVAVAKSQAKLGLIADALRLVQSITDEGRRAEALANFAVALPD